MGVNAVLACSNAFLYRLFTYSGAKPWTNDSPQEIATPKCVVMWCEPRVVFPLLLRLCTTVMCLLLRGGVCGQWSTLDPWAVPGHRYDERSDGVFAGAGSLRIVVRCAENWAAFLDKDLWGFGVFNPAEQAFLGW